MISFAFSVYPEDIRRRKMLKCDVYMRFTLIQYEAVKCRDTSSSRRVEYADRNVLSVRDLGTRRHNAEMRRISIVFLMEETLYNLLLRLFLRKP